MTNETSDLDPIQITAIRSFYDRYIEFYQKTLVKPVDLTSEELKGIKATFKRFLDNQDTLSHDLNPNYKKLILKYFADNLNFQIVPFRLIRHTSNYLGIKFDKIIYFIRSLFTHRKFQRKIKKWGFNSITEAYCQIFNVDLVETLNQIDLFLESTKEEYTTLLKEHLPYIKPNYHNDSIFLTNQEKKQFYQANWLSEKFTNADPREIIKNLLQFFFEKLYITNDTISKLDHKFNFSNDQGLFYTNITLAAIDWKENIITKFTVFNSVRKTYPFTQKAFIHELGHVITFSNLPNSGDIFTFIPCESAISELGGEFFEILLFLPDFINKIYKITDRNECEQIAKYFRLNDLLQKRFMAIQFKIYSQLLQNPKIININALSTQFKLKSLIKRHLSLQSSNLRLNSPNVIHYFDFIRGLLFIQEPFYNRLKNHSDKYTFFQNKMISFSKDLYFQSFNKIQQQFRSLNETKEKKGR